MRVLDLTRIIAGPVAGRTLAVAEFVVQPADPCLLDAPLATVAADYNLLPVALAGRPAFPAAHSRDARASR